MKKILVIAALSASFTFAQNATSDKAFLKAASEGNLAEIEAGRLAQEKASNAAVKQFAQRMVADHTKLQDQVMSVAARWSVILPGGPGDENRTAIGSLSAQSGTNFDRAYMAQMVKDHQQAVAAFEKEAKDGENPVYSDLATQMEPMIQAHLRLAERVAKQVGAPAAGTGH
jgi:putative membrane protein